MGLLSIRPEGVYGRDGLYEYLLTELVDSS
jgi:hypothetical protein